MPRDQEQWRLEVRRAVNNAVEYERVKQYDPFGLGVLKAMVLRIWVVSRGISEVQTVALANLMRDVANALEGRWR
jgi:hypothetical protein